MEGNATDTDLGWEERGLNSSSSSAEEGEKFFITNPAVEQKKEECDELHAQIPLPDPALGPYCPRTFDGWACWNDTPANSRVHAPCPDFIPGFNPSLLAYKDCDANGTWFKHPDTNEPWSNYTTCVDHGQLGLLQSVNNLYIAGYSISLIALCCSLFIFCFFKSLKCKRVTIHKNLFVSFIINNAMWLIWYKCVVEDTNVLFMNTGLCQALHVVLQYFLVSNYFWMFCEGLYLHTLLVVAFVAEDRIMKWFFLLGWGIPAVLITFYAIFRGISKEHNKHCWMSEGPYNHILNVPVVLSMLLNLFFLINIVRVLVTKLRAVNTGPDTHSTRKAVRATLILIPLLGLHYILVPFRPPEGSPGHGVYLIVSAVAASFQGLGVSLLFCFFNGEVLGIFKKKWNQHKLMKDRTKLHGRHDLLGREDSAARVEEKKEKAAYMKSSMTDGNTTVTNYGTTIEGDDV
ncbi:calcitonin gene-related peptide type 1 receptor-like isoform X2 [Scylla paramamosain]|uniref:calcitonin gene-related peptide type 1 receptor-like isoform X2 n=1 Tax=Scylla paramamosain TaxID=85552 RepID=UPI003083D464